jgi:hypothetical protein
MLYQILDASRTNAHFVVQDLRVPMSCVLIMLDAPIQSLLLRVLSMCIH